MLHHCEFGLGFPQAVLALSQLHTLDIHPVLGTVLPDRLLECANWPSLSLLRLLRGHPIYVSMYSLDSQMVLLLVNNAFRAAGRKSPLVVDEIYN